MANINRIVLPNYAHHIRERGVRKEPVFQEDSDYLVYLRMMTGFSAKHDLDIWAYALMTNHVHLVAVPKTEKAISKALHGAHTQYAKYFNAKYGYSGHVWERRPDFCAMAYSHMWNAVRYVERNPVRAHMVERAEDYLWSSAAAHCDLRDDILVSREFPIPDVIANWHEWLQIEDTNEEML